MKSWIIAIVLASIAIAPFLYLAYHKMGVAQRISRPSVVTIQFEAEKRSMALEPGAIFSVRSCKVVDGYKFGLYLENDKRIVAHLSVATKKEATQFVVDFLNKSISSPPTVTLLREVEDYWIVEFVVTKDGQTKNLVDLLRVEKLLLD